MTTDNAPDWAGVEVDDDDEAGAPAAAADQWPPPELLRWPFIDLAAVGSQQGPAPTLLRRTDGAMLLYPGATNLFVGPSGCGKTWAALLAVTQAHARGKRVAYFDMDNNGTAGFNERLRLLGVPEPKNEKVIYCAPGDGDQFKEAVQRLIDHGVDLVVFDTMAKMCGLFGADGNKAEDVTAVNRLGPEPLVRSGAAVLVIDHTGLSEDHQRTGRPSGSQQKTAQVDGASYTFTVRDPFTRGIGGAAVVVLTKDRHGRVNERMPTRPTGVGWAAGTFTLRPNPERGEDDLIAAWEPADGAGGPPTRPGRGRPRADTSGDVETLRALGIGPGATFKDAREALTDAGESMSTDRVKAALSKIKTDAAPRRDESQEVPLID